MGWLSRFQPPLIYGIAILLVAFQTLRAASLAMRYYAVKLGTSADASLDGAFAVFVLTLPAWISVTLQLMWATLLITLIALMFRSAWAVISCAVCYVCRTILFAHSNPVFEEALDRQTLAAELIPFILFSLMALSVGLLWWRGGLPFGWPGSPVR